MVKAAPASKQTSIPDKIETSAVTILDSEGNQSVEKISTGAASMNKTQKKIETGTSSKHKTQKKIETGTSSKHKTQKKIKTHSSQPADDWKVIEHQ